MKSFGGKWKQLAPPVGWAVLGVALRPRGHSLCPVRGASQGSCGHTLHIAGQDVTLTAPTAP